MILEVFTLPYSVPCERLMAELKQLQVDIPDITLKVLDVLEHGDYARENSVKIIPTMIAKQDDTEIFRIQGWKSYNDIANYFR